MKKYGFLFGAGAEISYGLPSGGQFALDIFRQDVGEYKQEFRKMRDEVIRTTAYANNELPEGYENKAISSFGKSVFENIVKDTVEGNRCSVIEKLAKFDDWASSIAEKCVLASGENVDALLKDMFDGDDLDNIQLSQVISYNNLFAQGNKLFDSHYFSALMLAYHKKKMKDDSLRLKLRNVLTSILQFQIGALSVDLASAINDNIFIKNPNDGNIDLLDDFGEILRIDYASTGVAGMEILFNELPNENPRNAEELIVEFSRRLLEHLYASVIDYKTLIDANWHYLYSPAKEWAKFTKIAIFLLSVRGYILKGVENIDKTIDSYYSQIKTAVKQNKFVISRAATTNYNTFIEDVLGVKVSFLNGSTNCWYDPYLNAMGNKEDLKDKENHILVPLIFTQSGTKPMTSIDMSFVYVDTYREWLGSDAIVVIGFGFNRDDEHINGLLRKLIDAEEKDLYVIGIDSESDRDIARKLKAKNSSKIHVIRVRKEDCRLTEDSSKLWIDALP